MEGEVSTLERSDVRDAGVSALFARHYRPMCRLAYVILGDPDLAEEIVMDALVRTFSGWSRIRDLDKAEFYLKRAVVNGCRSRIRRKSVESRVGELLRARPPTHGAWDADKHELQRDVWAAVLTLPERQRACVVLRYYEDLPDNEIADLLDCSVGTVKSQLHKARAKLETALQTMREEEAR